MENFSSIVSLVNFNFNWLDFIIILVFLFYAIEGIESGFINALFDLVNFILSFVFAIKLYSMVGAFLFVNFSIPQGFANAIGFFIVAVMVEIILSKVLVRMLRLWAKNLSMQKNIKQLSFLHRANHALGIVTGMLSAYILLSFFLTAIISFPMSPFVKQAISSSQISSVLVENAQGFEINIQQVFGGAVSETINFFTIEPGSNESINLKFTTKDIHVDESAENSMIDLVNKEREKRELLPLQSDIALTNVARQHSEDMFKRGYFSHYTPEGLSPFDRMAIANIFYTFAGENLALAPNTELAMQGLMSSPGHRANILSPQFRRVGIGVIDGGIYGEMFSQEFTD